MAEKDVALAIMGAAIGIAGLLLVFIGFLLSKADQTGLARLRGRIRIMAAVGLAPFLSSLFCAWASIWAVQGANWSQMHLYGVLKVVLALTGAYAIMSVVLEFI